MKHRTVNDYFKQQWPRLSLFAAFTLGVSFFAPLKNFQLKWLIDSKSKQEALGYMGLVFAITFSSWFFERLSRRSFTRIACGAVEQVRQRILEQVLYRTVAQYNAEGRRGLPLPPDYRPAHPLRRLLYVPVQHRVLGAASCSARWPCTSTSAR